MNSNIRYKIQTLFLAYLVILVSCAEDKVISPSLSSASETSKSQHPSLTLTKAGVENIRANLGSIPLFDVSLEAIKNEVDAEKTCCLNMWRFTKPYLSIPKRDLMLEVNYSGSV